MDINIKQTNMLQTDTIRAWSKVHRSQWEAQIEPWLNESNMWRWYLHLCPSAPKPQASTSWAIAKQVLPSCQTLLILYPSCRPATRAQHRAHRVPTVQVNVFRGAHLTPEFYLFIFLPLWEVWIEPLGQHMSRKSCSEKNSQNLGSAWQMPRNFGLMNLWGFECAETGQPEEALQSIVSGVNHSSFPLGLH